MQRHMWPRLLVLVLVVCWCVSATGCGGNHKLTQSNADKIRVGMDEKEVTDILGPPTTSSPISAPEMPGLAQTPKNMKKSVWKEGNKYIAVSFSEGKVMSSESSGF